MEQEKIINIEELVQDEHNFNKGTDEGGKLMERSFKEMGAGRSVLIDKHGKIIAGNKSQKAAIAAGIKRVRVIETTGDELIAVKRTDVELESEQGRKMALLDNLTTQVNLAWDEAELQTITGEIEGFDASEFGLELDEIPDVDLDGLKENGFIGGIREMRQNYTMTLVFPFEKKEILEEYIRKFSKNDLENKVLQLCQDAVAK